MTTHLQAQGVWQAADLGRCKEQLFSCRIQEGDSGLGTLFLVQTQSFLESGLTPGGQALAQGWTMYRFCSA